MRPEGLTAITDSEDFSTALGGFRLWYRDFKTGKVLEEVVEVLD